MNKYVFCTEDNEYFHLHKNQIYRIGDNILSPDYYITILRPDGYLPLALKKETFNKYFISNKEYRKLKIKKINDVNEGTM